MKPKTDEIFDGSEFLADFLHNGQGECPYCFLNFMHQHCPGYTLDQHVKINLPSHKSDESFHHTIVNSDIWKEWTKYQEEAMYFDVHESMEIGKISEEHWNEFIDYVMEQGEVRLEKLLRHSDQKLLDGFAHPKDCEICNKI